MIYTDPLFKKIHQIPIKNFFKFINSNKDGLNESEVNNNRTKYGLNKLTEKKENPLIIKFLLQFKNFFAILLLVGSALSFMGYFLVDDESSLIIGYALFFVAVLNSFFTFLQEYKAEQAMKSFKNLMKTQITVIRAGHKQSIDSEMLVPGDVIFLAEGDKVPADARLIDVNDLKVDHSALTGESEPQLRSISSTNKKTIYSRNMVFSGTLVQSGTGTAVVIATGDNTVLGNIAKTTMEVTTVESHLQNQLKHFIKIISRIALVLGVVFFGVGFFIQNDFWKNIVFAIGIIVANVPEGLLPTVTLTLSLAAQRLAKKKVLIRNIDSIETLGSLTVICSDKTGTLTENNLFVQGFYFNDGYYKFDHNSGRIYKNEKSVNIKEIKGSQLLLNLSILCNNSIVRNDKEFGDPIDICFKRFAKEFENISYVKKENQRVHEIPFSSESKYMITVNHNAHYSYYMKGAPEVVLGKCQSIFKNGKEVKLTKKDINEIKQKNHEYAQQGYRLIGCAIKNLSSFKKSNVDTNDYCFYGFFIMQDPPRADVKDTVMLCHTAGIKIIVISGDQGDTVASIAKQVGIAKNPLVLTSEDLLKLKDDELKEKLKSPELIIARALPHDKMRIVSLLQEMGEIVAVTGDGVNDAPALKKADVGISMGKSGTEVAKEASDIILLDDNFASIVNGIKEGRTVFKNIRSFIVYILTSNTPEIVPFLLFVLFGWPLALPVLLILAIDLGTDMLPAIGLGVEPVPKNIMQEKPRDKKSKLFNIKMIYRSYGLIGFLQTVFSYVIFFNILFKGGWSFGEIPESTLLGSAIAGFFTTIIITQIGNLFACRSIHNSAISSNFFKNKIIFLGILSEILILVLLIKVPFISHVFGTGAFPVYYLIWMIGGAIILFLIEEIRKFLYRKYDLLGIE